MIEKITNQNQIARHKLAEKINEIIDELNHILEERESGIKVYEEIVPNIKQDNRMIGSVTFDKIEGKMNPELADPYAELAKTKQALDIARHTIGWINQMIDEHVDKQAIKIKCEYALEEIKQTKA